MRPYEILLEIVERFTSIGEAEAAVTALDAGGIEVTLFDDAFVGINWLNSNAIGGVKVVIREDDYDAAADILDLPAEETAEPAEDATAEEKAVGGVVPHCPSCGLATIAAIPKLRIFGGLAVVLYGVGLAVSQLSLAVGALAIVGIVLMATPSHRCTTCGERFTWEVRTKLDESPLPQDLIEDHCPHCGSAEIHRLYHRRLKALTMFQLFTVLVIPLSLFPRRVCDNCGRKSY